MLSGGSPPMQNKETRIALLAEKPPEPGVVRAAEQLRDAGFVVMIVSTCPDAWQIPGCRVIPVPEGDAPRRWIPPADWVLSADAHSAGGAHRRRRLPALPELLPLPVTRDGVRARLGAPNRRSGEPSISVCMIVRDEEANLPRALTSVLGIADEIIVVDTGSRDASPEIARSFGARVDHFAWRDDFAAARNHALSLATEAWILILDADEALGDSFRRAVRGVLRSTTAGGLYSPLVNIQEGSADQRRDPVLRLFRNKPQHRFRGRVHEQVAAAIVQGGGQIVEAPQLEILHFGYTPEENLRKGRHERNLRLLRLAHREEPDNAMYWHYLGTAHIHLDELREAEAWLRRVVAAQATPLVRGYTLRYLTGIHLYRRDYAEAWETLALPRTALLRSDHLVQAGELARLDQDHILAAAVAKALRSLSPNAHGSAAARRHSAAVLSAFAAEAEGRPDLAAALLLEHLKDFPVDAPAADYWVTLLYRTGDLRAATVEAMRALPYPTVSHAVIALLLRRGEWDWAGSLAEQLRARTLVPLPSAHALVRGRGYDAAQILPVTTPETATHLALLGLDTGREDWVRRAEPELTAVRRQCIREITGECAPDPEHDWLRVQWLHLAARYRMDNLLARIGTRMSGGLAHGISDVARALWESDRQDAAVQFALQHPEVPGCALVLGLVAYDAGDWALAGDLLALAAAGADLPAGAYWRAAEALRRAGRAEEAEAVIREGRRRRPLSPLLGGQPPAI